MKALITLAVAAGILAGTGSVSLAGQHDRKTGRDIKAIRREIVDIDVKIAHERKEMESDRQHHNWSKLRHDTKEMAAYKSRRDALQAELDALRDFRRDRADR